MIVGFFGHKETLYPCSAAPYICAGCRDMPERLLSARKAMAQHWETCKGRPLERN